MDDEKERECKIILEKKNYYDIQKHSYVNNDVLVMQQNAKQLYTIPICWNPSKRWIVGFDFSENENLYGICNDGTIYKFDLLLKEARELLTSEKFIQEIIYNQEYAVEKANPVKEVFKVPWSILFC